MGKLQKDSDLEIVIKKCVVLTVSIQKNGHLGLNLSYDVAKSWIMVKSITDGCVKKYNDVANRERQLKAPFRILQVDGSDGKANLLYEKLKSANGSVELTVSQAMEASEQA